MYTFAGGYQRVFDVSEGGGDETENTVLESTDCDNKVRRQGYRQEV